jgi:hypothetical protein
VSGCIACGRGFHRECLRGCKRCHPEPIVPVQESVETEKENETPTSVSDDTPRSPKKTNLKDPKSTGRKRAARLYPILPDDPCEWRGKKNCGGGLRPIIGCYDGNQEHRHHGPVKDTVRNELGNVHRICTDCHVHWHELNDLIYKQSDYELLPHTPVEAGTEEIIQNILDWKAGIMGQRFQLASSLNKTKKVLEDGDE